MRASTSLLLAFLFLYLLGLLLFLVFSALAAAASSVLATFLAVAGLRSTLPLFAIYDQNALTSVLAAVSSVVACLTAVETGFVAE